MKISFYISFYFGLTLFTFYLLNKIEYIENETDLKVCIFISLFWTITFPILIVCLISKIIYLVFKKIYESINSKMK